MLLFDIGANRGDAVVAGLDKGFDKIIALEPAPQMFYLLYNNFKHDERVIPLKYAVSSSNNEKIEFYFLDLLEHRNVSNEIANKLNVEHQSPQILLISNGKCFFNASHEAIDFKGLQEKI
jgi:FkbM family methyltransferase